MALTRITRGVIKPNENYDTHNIVSTGIVTSVGLDVNGNADISGSLSVGGVLTYEDVTSIDSVGIITARTGLVSPYADIDDFVSVGNNIHLGNAGVITATSFVGSGAALTGIDATAIKDSGGNVKIQAQASGAIHTGVSTFQDLDVDGHTNLDNVSIAGVTTIANNQELVIGENADSQYTTRIKQIPSGSGGSLSITTRLPRIYAHDTRIIDKDSGNTHAYFWPGQIGLYASGSEKIQITGGSVNITNANLSVSRDIDVDGHTNLDNVSVAGITTISGVLHTSNTPASIRVAQDIQHLSDTDTKISFPADDTISLDTGGTQGIRITSAQKLLVGDHTSSRSIGNSQHIIQTEGTSADENGISLYSLTNNQHAAHFSFGKSRNNSTVADNDFLGHIIWCAHDGTDVNSTAARITASIDGATGSNDTPGRLEFYTTSDGSHLPTERLRINSSGHVVPAADSSYDLGLTGTRFRAAYVDTYYGDGSNLTGITQTTINNNADNRIITGSGSANTLEAEANFTFSGSKAIMKHGATTTVSDRGLMLQASTSLTNGQVLPGINLNPNTNVDRPRAGIAGIGHGSSNGTAGMHLIFMTAYRDDGSQLTSSDERVRITSAGQFLVGATSSSGARGIIQQNSSDTNPLDQNTSADSSGLRIQNYSFGVGRYTALSLEACSASQVQSASIIAQSVTNGQAPDIIIAQRTSVGGNTERLRIDSSGRVMIGTATEGHENADTLTISESGTAGMTIRSTSSNCHIYFSDATSGAGEYVGQLGYNHGSDYMFFHTGGSERLRADSSGITVTGTVDSASDVILKENIKTIDNALDKVTKLRGVEYDYKENKKHSIGVIAQEVEEVLPELVNGSEQKSVAYGNIAAVLIEAIKEQNEVINKMKKEIEDLKG